MGHCFELWNMLYNVVNLKAILIIADEYNDAVSNELSK